MLLEKLSSRVINFFSSVVSNKKARFLNHLIYFWFLNMSQSLRFNIYSIHSYIQSIWLIKTFFKIKFAWMHLTGNKKGCSNLLVCVHSLSYFVQLASTCYDIFEMLLTTKDCRWCWNIFSLLRLLQFIDIKVKWQHPKTLHVRIHRYSILYIK